MKPDNLEHGIEKLKEQAKETGKKTADWLRKHWSMAALAGGLCAAALIIGLGSGKNRQDLDQTPLRSVEERSMSDAAAEGGESGSDERLAPKLEEDQIQLLEGLVKVLKDRDLATGGAMLLDHEQRLDYLFYQVMGGERYLYRDGELFGELEGEGLVLTRPMTAFYGTLVEGKPEGEGVMIQGIQLDGLRYDYADGLWSGGRLHGKATAGYHYFEGSGEGESLEVRRTGIFVDDLMDGAFTYETVNKEGETTIWDMKAERGKTKLEDGWIHDEEKQYYYLPSRELDNHTYVIPDSEIEEIRWRNMLPWEE